MSFSNISILRDTAKSWPFCRVENKKVSRHAAIYAVAIRVGKRIDVGEAVLAVGPTASIVDYFSKDVMDCRTRVG